MKKDHLVSDFRKKILLSWGSNPRKWDKTWRNLWQWEGGRNIRVELRIIDFSTWKYYILWITFYLIIEQSLILFQKNSHKITCSNIRYSRVLGYIQDFFSLIFRMEHVTQMLNVKPKKALLQDHVQKVMEFVVSVSFYLSIYLFF